MGCLKKLTGSSQTAGLTGLVDPFWSVRHRAIEHLHSIIDRLDEHRKNLVFKLFAKQLCAEKVRPVKNLLKNIYETFYPNNPIWTEIFDEHEESIKEERNKHEKQLESKQLFIRKWKGKSPYESNQDDSLENNIELSEEVQIDLIDIELEKEMLEVEEEKLDDLF